MVGDPGGRMGAAADDYRRRARWCAASVLVTMIMGFFSAGLPGPGFAWGTGLFAAGCACLGGTLVLRLVLRAWPLSRWVWTR